MGKKILVMDDVSAVRRTVGTLLKRLGYEVVEAEDGKQGLKIVKEERPDLAIVDLMMPILDGFDFIRVLRNYGDESKDIPVLVLTAKGNKESFMKAFKAGANDFVVKPFDVNEVVSKIKKLLGEEEKE